MMHTEKGGSALSFYFGWTKLWERPLLCAWPHHRRLPLSRVLTELREGLLFRSAATTSTVLPVANNGDPASTPTAGFCQRFGVCLTWYHQLQRAHWHLSGRCTATARRDTQPALKPPVSFLQQVGTE